MKLLTAMLAATAIAFTALSARADDISLHSEFDGLFTIGTALNVNQIMSDDPVFHEFVVRHFNAVTGENAMKWERIHPAEDQYNWEPADALAAFANDNGIHLTGHTLVWHQQTPDWVFEDADGNAASPRTFA